jgi:hypothetical protein
MNKCQDVNKPRDLTFNEQDIIEAGLLHYSQKTIMKEVEGVSTMVAAHYKKQ